MLVVSAILWAEVLLGVVSDLFNYTVNLALVESAAGLAAVLLGLLLSRHRLKAAALCEQVLCPEFGLRNILLRPYVL